MAHATRAALVRSQNASRGHARGCLATVTDRAEARYQRRARTNSTALRAREGIIKLPSKLLSYRRPTTRLDRPFRMKPQNAHRTTLPIRGAGVLPPFLSGAHVRPPTLQAPTSDHPPTQIAEMVLEATSPPRQTKRTPRLRGAFYYRYPILY